MAKEQFAARSKGYGVMIPVRIDLIAESGEAAIEQAAAMIEAALSVGQYSFSVKSDQADVVYIDYTTDR